MKSEKHILCNYKGGKIIFPDRTEIYSDHVRFVSRSRKEIYENEADIIELMIRKISD